MSKESSSSGGGIGLLGIIFIVFLVLKLTGTGMVANWSWWWVTSPLWLPLAIMLTIGLIYLLVKGVILLIDWIIWKVGKYRKVSFHTKKIIDELKKKDSK